MSLHRLYDLDGSSAQSSDELDRLLHEKEYVDGFQKLPEGELIQLVDYLNNVRHPHTDRIPLIVFDTGPRLP